MTSSDGFLSLVKHALDHLYEYQVLADHPLALLLTPDGSRGVAFRAERFNRLILESIDAINPPEAPTKDTLLVRAYRLLVRRYVEEWPLPEIMQELGLSRTQFFREQRKAIAVLASTLRNRIPTEALMIDAPAQSPLSQPSTLPDALGTNLGTEAERIVQGVERIDLDSLIRGALSVLKTLARERGIALHYTAGAQPLVMFGSRTLVRQVVVCCLSTLVTREGAVSVRIATEAVGKNVLISFSARHRAAASSGQPTLSESMTRIQELVDVARGRWLGVRLVDDECRCRFELPIGRPQSVLVIDDNEGVAKVFGAFLEDSGYQVIGCTSGDDALRSAADLRPIAITLDIMMPNQDGWEILQTLKADRTTSEIPIIVCSVLEDPALAKSLGADAYLRKPVAEAELRATLQELV